MNRYGKVQCLDMDWNNVKTISAKELAYCIVEYSLTKEVPTDRQDAVQREIQAYKAVKIKEFIADMLQDGGYDTDLFHTTFEVETAFAEEICLYNREMEKTEVYDHEYKNTDTYSRDYKSMLETFRTARDKYIKMGGSVTDIDTLLDTLTEPTKTTLMQDIYADRERITQTFIDLGTSPTRAKKIAIAITTNIYYALKKPSEY